MFKSAAVYVLDKCLGFVKNHYRRIVLFLLGVLLGAFLYGKAFGEVSTLPGPPEQFKDWPRVGLQMGRCPDGRVIVIKQYAKTPNYDNVGAITMEDQVGVFLWVYYTAKDEDAPAKWYAWLDGRDGKFYMGDQTDVRAYADSPCDIVRPALEQKG